MASCDCHGTAMDGYMGLHDMLWDTIGCYGTPWDCRGTVMALSGHFLGESMHHGTLAPSWGSLERPWDGHGTMGLTATTLSLQLYGTSWYFHDSRVAISRNDCHESFLGHDIQP